MPAWIAGIQIRKDASGDIHVSLDSSTPCWNDAIEGSAGTDQGPCDPYSQGRPVRVCRKLWLFPAAKRGLHCF
jgi:hypothetical protein